MTFLKLLLNSSIIYVAIMVIASPINDEESKIEDLKIEELESEIVRSILNKSSYIPDYTLPLHYNMKLILLNDYLVNECIITIYIIYVTQYIRFHVPDSTNIRISKLKQNRSIIYNETISINRDRNNVVLDFGDVLLRGMYDLYIEIKVPINIVRESFGSPYINENGEKEWLIATGIQMKKQQIFPYWDKPELGITFVISIMHDLTYEALSNMPIRETRFTYDNMAWTYFHQTTLMSIDSIAFLVSGFYRTTIWVDKTISQSIWYRPQSKLHLKFAENVILLASVYMHNCTWNIMKRVLKRTSVSFESKVDHVAIPDLQDEIKQTFGFIFYREADITYNEELDPVGCKMIIARLIVRGLVQKYISNLLRPTHLWPHAWLNEGFNVFLQTYIINKALFNSRIMNLFVVQVHHELLYLNTYVVINSAMEYNSYPENYLYSSISHIKGSIIWRMLERTLPSDIFLMGINKYLYNQCIEPKATTSDNLWNAIRSIMIELNLKYDFNIKSTIDSWIMQRCPSVLEVTRNYTTDIVTISVQFYNELDKKQYYIPVTYTTESNPDFTITWTNIWLTPWHSKIEFFLEKNQWIIFNLQQAEKKLEFSVFWELASYLTQERNYIAWYPMIKAFEFLSNIFPFLDFYPEFKEVLKFNSIMRNLKFNLWNLYDERNINDHTKCLKQELAKWECIINGYLCEEKSSHHLKWHLANPKKNKLLPGWKRWTYCNGLKTADRDTWNKVFNDYMKGNDTILECLAYSKNSEIIINYLEIKLPQILLKPMYNLSHLQLEPIERADALNTNIFLSIIERHTKYMLTNLLNNYKIIKHKKVNEIVTLIVIINNAYSKEQLDEVKKFIKKELKSLINVVYKIETRSWEIERQTKYFRSLFNN